MKQAQRQGCGKDFRVATKIKTIGGIMFKELHNGAVVKMGRVDQLSVAHYYGLTLAQLRQLHMFDGADTRWVDMDDNSVIETLKKIDKEVK